MEAQWICDRRSLRTLMRHHPHWTNPQYAQAIGRSVSWVKKWKIRLSQAPANDLQVLFSRSRAHHAPYPRWHPQVLHRLGEMREQPPEHLHRVPGHKALVYYLQCDPELQALGVPVPRSSRTIWKLLCQQGYILPRPARHHQELEPREPLEEIQMDFKDASTVRADPSGEGKRQHVVEVCHFVDAGTSILLSAQAHDAFREETAFEAVLAFLHIYGLPPMLTFDRDPRWIGSSSGRDFPSPRVRFLTCLGIVANICPPHRPDKNDLAAYCPPCVRLGCLLIFVSIFLRSVFIGWFKDSDPMIVGPIHGKQTCPSPVHES